MKECHISFKFPIVPRQNYVEWSDGRRNTLKRRRTCMLHLSRTSARKQSGTRSEKLGATARFLTFTTSGIPTQSMKLIWSKPKRLVLTLFQTLSVAVVHVGNIPAECIAKFVGHGQTILCGRPSEVVPHALAIQAYFRASGDRLLEQDQQQKKLDLIKSCVKFLLSPNKDELTEEPLHF